VGLISRREEKRFPLEMNEPKGIGVQPGQRSIKCAAAHEPHQSEAMYAVWFHVLVGTRCARIPKTQNALGKKSLMFGMTFDFLKWEGSLCSPLVVLRGDKGRSTLYVIGRGEEHQEVETRWPWCMNELRKVKFHR
jgi:hypothetical protein